MDYATITTRRRTNATVSGTLVVAVLALAACGGGGSSADETSSPIESAADPSTEVTTEGSAEPTRQSVSEAPDVVGLRLNEARDLLDGFDITEVDSTGQGRGVWAARNWTVIGQEWAGDAVTLHLLNERDEQPGASSEAAPSTSTVPETTQVPTTTTGRSPERDWFGEFRESFGFDGDLPLGEVPDWSYAVLDIEDCGGWLCTLVQTHDVDAQHAACTWIWLMFDMKVQIEGPGGVPSAVRSPYLSDGPCQRS